MQKFILIWFGQLVSTIGSYMTRFALSLWAWELTGSATALALIGFFSLLPCIPISLFAGIIVDHVNRKYLMILGDVIAAISTLTILILYVSGNLAIWHLYLAASVKGGFGQIQHLAYSTSITLLVSPQSYTRASSMDSAVHYGSNIIAPAMAGVLYPIIGLGGILPIDLMTFGVAIVTLVFIHIPQPASQSTTEIETLLSKLTFGFREVWRQPSLRSLLLISTLLWFFHDLGGAVYKPMILARTNGSAQVLASTASAAGIGGVTGAILLSVWGGPKRRVTGMLTGVIGAGVSKTMFGLGRSPLIWLPAQFCSSLNFPLLGSSETALWMTQIAPERQGRVFAANALVVEVVTAIATLIAGLLADRVFEPMMQSNTPFASFFSPIIGTGPGAGIALLYVITSIGLLFTGITGFAMPHLQNMESSEAK